MSAITAIFNLDKSPIKEQQLWLVNNSLSHRGGDNQDIWFNQNIGLGHQLRWVTPESLLEKLPLKNSSGHLIITCDARLDNRDELIKILNLQTKRTTEVTDAEIILAGFEKWGVDCPAKLIGDFVFAIWDAKEQQLFCARDPLGVKHFYYFYQPGKLFALASEIKALLVHGFIPSELNEEYLGDYLLLNQEDKESTFYQNIKRLPATHSLLVGYRDLQIRRYWQPSPQEIKLKNDAEYQEAFREKFIEAVTCRLRSNYPVGSMLSGGLDSSSIVCVASNFLKAQGRKPLQTFSAIFPTVAQLDSRIDEMKYMQLVIKQTGCKPNFVNADNSNPLKEMKKIIWHADHPVGAPNVYMDWEIYKAAKEKDVRVLLSGTDGDSTVGYGYEDFKSLAERGKFWLLMKNAQALSKNMPHRKHTFKKLVWNRGIKEMFPQFLISLWKTLRPVPIAEKKVFQHKYIRQYNTVKIEFKKEFDLENRITKYHELSYPTNCSPPEQHWNGLTSGHFSNALEQLEKISAVFGIAPQYPFFDRRLIEFCIGLPPGQRIYKGWTRSIFRFAMNNILPPDVQWRTDKSNIGVSLKVNLLKYGIRELKEAIYENAWRLEKYVDTQSLQEAMSEYQLKPMQKESEALLILTNVYLSNWLKQTEFCTTA